MSRLERMFAQVKGRQQAALCTYLMSGDPDPDASLGFLEACLAGGADLIELGMPFSDPIADGPVIQAAAARALSSGTRLETCLELAARARERTQAPLVLMGYLNPILAFGEERFLDRCAQAGVDALILPDLPPEEAGLFLELAAARKIAVAFLLAPTTTPERLERILRAATGFVYFVSLTGVTGARRELPADLADRLGQVRARCPVPLVVGFGISGPEQARALAPHADGIVVGSAIVQTLAQPGPLERRRLAVEQQVRALKGALGPA